MDETHYTHAHIQTHAHTCKLTQTHARSCTHTLTHSLCQVDHKPNELLAINMRLTLNNLIQHGAQHTEGRVLRPHVIHRETPSRQFHKRYCVIVSLSCPIFWWIYLMLRTARKMTCLVAHRPESTAHRANRHTLSHQSLVNETSLPGTKVITFCSKADKKGCGRER